MGGYQSKRRIERRRKIQDLFIAARDNQVERVTYLLNYSKADISPEVCDANGRDALYWAALAGNLEIVRILLKAKGSYQRNYCRLYSFGAPKHYGTVKGRNLKTKNPSTVYFDRLERRYMERCAGVCELPHSATIMHIAVVMGYTSLVQELLDRYQYWFSIYLRDLRNSQNQRPIELAHAIDDDVMISILNEAGSSLDQIGPMGID